MTAQGPTAAARPGDSLDRTLVCGVGGLLAALLAFCGIVLAVRRVGGGFDPPGSAALLAAAAIGGLLVMASDGIVRVARMIPIWRAVSRVGYLLSLAALGFPPRLSGRFDGAALLVAASVAAMVVAGPFLRRGTRGWISGGLRIPRWSPAGPVPSPVAPRVAAIPSSAATPGHLLQRLERFEIDGVECVRGTLALTVAEGARVAHGHVGFCPSFRETPHMEVGTAFDGVEAVVTAPEIVPWGARIECRLDEPADEPVEIPVDFVARAPA